MKIVIYSPLSYSKHLSFVFLLNSEDTLKNIGNQTVDGPHWLLEYEEIKIPKYLLCSTEEINLYRVETTWGWVNDDRIFTFGWTTPLSGKKLSSKW